MAVAFKESKALAVILWFASFFVLWEAIALVLKYVIKVPYADTKLPLLNVVVVEMIRQHTTLLNQSEVTFFNAMVGFALGAVVGSAIAVLMGMWKTMERIIMPYAVASQMVPVIGLAPIVFGVLHNATLSRIAISGYVTFLPVSISVLRGLKSVGTTHLELMRICAASRAGVFTKLKWKAALPNLFVGLKLSAPLAVTAAILVELMGAPNGIGVMMMNSIYYGTNEIYMFWATVIASVSIGMLAFLLVVVLERLITPWQPEFRRKVG